jgi:hypothetical protein
MNTCTDAQACVWRYTYTQNGFSTIRIESCGEGAIISSSSLWGWGLKSQTW